MSFSELGAELKQLFRRGVEGEVSEEAFNELALRIFRFQAIENRAYGAFVRRRGVRPEEVADWREIPFLPTDAFKEFPLVAGPPGRVQRVFRTSGTTSSGVRRGEHHVLDLDLYRESLLPNFRTHLLAGDERITILCLLPDPGTVPDSSLSFMMGEVVARWGEEGSGFFVGRDGGIEEAAFRRSIAAACADDRPVLIAGTAFALVVWIETARTRGWRAVLPTGSRIMETGGYKGRTRALSRAELHQGLREVFGVEPDRVVGEYGMTEMLSQFYEPVLRAGAEGGLGGGKRDTLRARPLGQAGVGGGGGPSGAVQPDSWAIRRYVPPPWVRTRVLDPLSLEPLPEGETGVLAHLDLANLGSVAALLTQDLGRAVAGGFELAGRAPGAEARGCSLAMEDFLLTVGDLR